MPTLKSDFPQHQVCSYGYLCVKCGAQCEDWTLFYFGKEGALNALEQIIPGKINRIEGQPILIRTLCDTCDEANHALRILELDSAKMRERSEKFMNLCPQIYRESDPTRLPAAQLRMILSYEVGERGLLCIGDSRKGKTRSAWALMRKLVMQGYAIEAMTEVEYSIKLKMFRSIDEFRARLCAAPVFFLDDLGHVGAGQRHLEELYHIVEYRTSHQKPIICTTQFTGEEMGERSGRNKTMAAIVNRLREFCDVIDFNK